jgi:hypothetical protein
MTAYAHDDDDKGDGGSDDDDESEVSPDDVLKVFETS